MEIARASTIDWLSYTIPWTSPRIKRLSPQISYNLVCDRASGMIESWYMEPAMHGYAWQYVSVAKPGLRVMLSRENHEMGVHVQFAGSALSGENAMDRLAYAIEAGGSITRLDLAVDVASAWDIPKIYQDCQDGAAETRVRKFSLITSTDGTTMYAGSRSSEKYLRIYDKQAQMKSSRPWTRVELECKGRFANNIAKFIMAEGIGATPQIIRGFFDLPHMPEWADVMNSNTDRVSLPKIERHSNTRGWLLEQVAPALAKYIEQHPEFEREFQERLLLLLPIQE